MVVKNYQEKLAIDEGVQVSFDSGLCTVKGAQGEIKRSLLHPLIQIVVEGNEVVFTVSRYTRREKTMLGTFKAHIKNMMKGVTEPFVYTLKVCSGHFPMNISYSNNTFTVKNFIGEKIPRVLEVHQGVDVVLNGEEITVTSVNKELAGQTAASIETLCKRPGFDRRIFQQGIFITSKAGKQV